MRVDYECEICGKKTIRRNQLENTSKDETPTEEFFYSPNKPYGGGHRSSSSGGGSGSSGSSGSSSDRPDNPFMPHYQQESGNTCMYCKYFDANSCKYYDVPQFVRPNSKACWNFS